MYVYVQVYSEFRILSVNPFAAAVKHRNPAVRLSWLWRQQHPAQHKAWSSWRRCRVEGIDVRSTLLHGNWRVKTSIGLIAHLWTFASGRWCAMIWYKETVRNFVSDPDPESSPRETLESMTQVDKRLKTSVVLVEHNAAITAAERSRQSCVWFHADVSPWITTPFIISPRCISRTILLGRHHYQYQLADIFHKDIISSFLCSKQLTSFNPVWHSWPLPFEEDLLWFWEVASMLKASLPKLGERPQPKVQKNEVRVLWFFRRRDRNVKTSWNHP